MGTWAALFMSLAGPVARQVLLSLGFGFVTFVGLSAALTTLLNMAKTAWAGNIASVAQILAIAGANTGLAIIAGALITRVSMVQLKKLIPK